MSQSPSTETGTVTTITLRDESSKNFKPSPNFKHKNYLKSKFEEDMNYIPANDPSKQNGLITENVTVHPPLPPNSPPLDCPLNLNLKKEITDDKYAISTWNHSEGFAQEESNRTLSDQGDGEDSEEKDLIMCRDFIRQKCKRGAACIYAHTIIKSQLKYVYKFCRDFENQRCSRPVCYFVHATTFEKEHFLRTGFLPSHASAHLESNLDTNGPQSISPTFNNPPPKIQTRMIDCASTGVAAASAVTPCVVGDACVAVYGMPSLSTVSKDPLNREWRESHEAFSCSPRDIAASDPVTMKCKRCDVTEMRLQHSMSQMAQKLKDFEELDENIELIVKKHHRLHSVLRMLLQPMAKGQLNLPSPQRLSVLADKRNKDALISQMNVLMTKIMLGTDEIGSPESGLST